MQTKRASHKLTSTIHWYFKINKTHIFTLLQNNVNP